MATPIPYTSKHRVQFSDLDPYQHMNTGTYARYFVDHRMECLRDTVGWDLAALGMSEYSTALNAFLYQSTAWPERAVTLIVPYAAGGITDVLARLTAEHLQSKFKQSFVVQNETGAGGLIGAANAAHAGGILGAGALYRLR